MNKSIYQLRYQLIDNLLSDAEFLKLKLNITEDITQLNRNIAEFRDIKKIDSIGAVIAFFTIAARKGKVYDLHEKRLIKMKNNLTEFMLLS